MLWKGRRQSDNIQDSRGQRRRWPRNAGRRFGRNPIRIPMGRGGGGGLSTIIILVVLFFALRACGIDPLQILTGGDGGPAGVPGGGGQVTESQPKASDEMTQFVGVVLAETEDVWNGIFQAEGLKYEEPQLVLFAGQVQVGLRLRVVRVRPVLLPRRQEGLSRHLLLRPARPPVRRVGRFRAGLCDRA